MAIRTIPVFLRVLRTLPEGTFQSGANKLNAACYGKRTTELTQVNDVSARGFLVRAMPVKRKLRSMKGRAKRSGERREIFHRRRGWQTEAAGHLRQLDGVSLFMFKLEMNG